MSAIQNALDELAHISQTDTTEAREELAALRSELEAVKAENKRLKRIEKIAYTICKVVASGVIVRTANACPHGNYATAPHNHPWWCDDCFWELQDALGFKK